MCHFLSQYFVVSTVSLLAVKIPLPRNNDTTIDVVLNKKPKHNCD